MFRSLKTSIDKYFKKEKTQPMFQHGLIEKIWKKKAGKTVVNNTQIIKFEKNILLIKVATPTWRNELLFHRKKIIKKLNNNKESILIKDIKLI